MTGKRRRELIEAVGKALLMKEWKEIEGGRPSARDFEKYWKEGGSYVVIHRERAQTAVRAMEKFEREK